MNRVQVLSGVAWMSVLLATGARAEILGTLQCIHFSVYSNHDRIIELLTMVPYASGQ